MEEKGKDVSRRSDLHWGVGDYFRNVSAVVGVIAVCLFLLVFAALVLSARFIFDALRLLLVVAKMTLFAPVVLMWRTWETPDQTLTTSFMWLGAMTLAHFCFWPWLFWG
jgi:hypothetical protein